MCALLATLKNLLYNATIKYFFQASLAFLCTASYLTTALASLQKPVSILDPNDAKWKYVKKLDTIVNFKPFNSDQFISQQFSELEYFSAMLLQAQCSAVQHCNFFKLAKHFFVLHLLVCKNVRAFCTQMT